MPALMWLDQQVDLRSAARGAADGFTMPVPYGIDIAPDGGVWFSQLNEDRIGRIDPETLAVELFETPFPAPRRLRFDRSGTLWVPSFSAGLLAAFDPRTQRYRSCELPIRPLLGEVPYALAVHPLTQDVWVCGTNSDTLDALPTPADASVDGVSAADARHLHARARLRRRGPRLDLELELAVLADRRRPAARAAPRPRPGRQRGASWRRSLAGE